MFEDCQRKLGNSFWDQVPIDLFLLNPPFDPLHPEIVGEKHEDMRQMAPGKVRFESKFWPSIALLYITITIYVIYIHYNTCQHKHVCYIYLHPRKSTINAHLKDLCWLNSFSPNECSCTTLGMFPLCAFWSHNSERKYPGNEHKYPSVRTQMRAFSSSEHKHIKESEWAMSRKC